MFWSIFIQSTAFIAAIVVLGGIVGWLTAIPKQHP